VLAREATTDLGVDAEALGVVVVALHESLVGVLFGQEATGEVGG
jgi:hypothetical protein